jgi:membrane protease YdiL (CAAX protease family)
MFAVVNVPPLASVFTVLVAPPLTKLVAYLGVVLLRLERRIGRAWIAATIVVVDRAARTPCTRCWSATAAWT